MKYIYIYIYMTLVVVAYETNAQNKIAHYERFVGITVDGQ